MKSSKVLMSFIVLLAFSLLLVGCGGGKQEGASSNGASTAPEQAPQETSAEIDFPTKPIELIVPFGAGGATDQIARAIEKGISKHLPNGQTMVINNQGGGASVPGTSLIANAKPDGYTIGFVAPGPISIQPHFGMAPYSPDDFEGVIRIAQNPVLFAVGADTPWQTFEEWYEYVKENPGKFSYGSGGIGNTPQVAMEKFLIANDLDVKYVPFDSSNEAHVALLGGHIEGGVSSPQQYKGQEDEIRILANLGSIKHDFYEDVPTLIELGFEQITDVYFGIVAPKDTPEEIITILHDAIKATLDDPEVIEMIENNGVTVDYAGSEDFTNQIKYEYHDYGVVLKELGLID